MDDKLSNQSAGLLGLDLTVIFTAALFILKYTKKDLQWFLKTVLETQTPTNSEESQDKSLKACFLDIYCGKSYIKCYNFCQQYEDHFAIAGAKSTNQILFAMSFFGDQIRFCW